MNEEFNERARKEEERWITQNQKEENKAPFYWWGGLVLCALLSPGFSNEAIALVGGAGAFAALGGIIMIEHRRWLHLVLGIIVFIGIGYLADHSWHHPSDDNYSQND